MFIQLPYKHRSSKLHVHTLNISLFIYREMNQQTAKILKISTCHQKHRIGKDKICMFYFQQMGCGHIYVCTCMGGHILMHFDITFSISVSKMIASKRQTAYISQVIFMNKGGLLNINISFTGFKVRS